MDVSNIIVVPKNSKYERDLQKFGLTHDQLVQRYRTEGVDVNDVISSHCRQKALLDALKGFFDENQFVPWGEISKEKAAKADLIIALGGDNHFQYVSHFVDDTPMMGMNSDPSTSGGALLYHTTTDFANALKKLERGDFDLEGWIRLETKLNGTQIEPAVCEVFLGDSRRKNTSRYILELNGKTETQKSSGLLVVTGAGSTGWYDSECRYLHEHGNLFPKTAKYAKFLATSPSRGRLCGYSMADGVLEEDVELTVRSLHDREGVISPDSLAEHDFKRGATAVIRISDKLLRVVKVDKNE